LTPPAINDALIGSARATGIFVLVLVLVLVIVIVIVIVIDDNSPFRGRERERGRLRQNFLGRRDGKMIRVGVCLSGCGVMDGSEIQEAVLTLLALDQAGAAAVCVAPNVAQADVVDHLKGAPAAETRNVLTESARIARGAVRDLAQVRAAELDALIFPGGFGAAKNLCSFASEGVRCAVNPEVERLVGEMIEAHKPIGAICIAPAMLARILGRRAVRAKLTIGTDPETARAINEMGAEHCDCEVSGHVVDARHKIVSTPAYMLGRGPAEVFEGIRRLVEDLLKLAAGDYRGS
jgi:enhancing lycopene biosynthesis protein 2